MKLLQIAFTKLREYFTANNGRKIFFYSLLVVILSFTIYAILRFAFFYYLASLALVVAGVGTLWDSMYSRYLFLKKIREIQYAHLKEITDKQDAGEDVAVTPTFSLEEKKYLRRRKWNFVVAILFKVGIVIALFSLLLSL